MKVFPRKDVARSAQLAFGPSGSIAPLEKSREFGGSVLLPSPAVANAMLSRVIDATTGQAAYGVPWKKRKVAGHRGHVRVAWGRHASKHPGF